MPISDTGIMGPLKFGGPWQISTLPMGQNGSAHIPKVGSARESS
jgi:hypothetical protein